GMDIPPRAQWVRVMFHELQRISSHLVWLGTSALDMGAMTVFLYCFREREELLRIYEAVSAHRIMTSYFPIPRLPLELPIGLYDWIKRFASTFEEKVDEYEDLLTNNPIWRQRTKDVAKLSLEDGIALGASGATLRASGLDWDLRRDMPYSGYEHFQFK